MTHELPPLVDSHCHLTWESFDEDRADVIARMSDEGVAQAVVVATSVENARTCAALCKDHEGLFPTVGIHPSEVPAELDEALAAFDEELHRGGYVAIGETGLDYYWDDSLAEPQRRSFRHHCRRAVENDLPVVVHIRDKDGSWKAFDDVGGLWAITSNFSDTPSDIFFIDPATTAEAKAKNRRIELKLTEK